MAALPASLQAVLFFNNVLLNRLFSNAAHPFIPLEQN